jgi:hypothetical protein
MDEIYIKKIFNLKNTCDELFIYPLINKFEKKYITRNLSNDEIQLLKKNISSVQKKIIITNIIQTEIYYKNLIKIHQNDNLNKSSCIIYCTKQYNDVIINSDLLILSSITKIDENEYPYLNKNSYDDIIYKTMDIYDFYSFKVVFCSQNNKNIIYIDISNIKQNNKDANMLIEIYNIIHKSIK